MEGEFERAEEMARKAVEREKEVLGVDHPTTLRTMHTLACSWHVLGRCEVAETLISEVVESKRRVLGSTHLDTVLAVRMLARWQEERRRREFEGNTALLFEELKAGLAPKTVDAIEAISSLAAIRCWQGGSRSSRHLGPCSQPRAVRYRQPHHAINHETTRIIIV